MISVRPLLFRAMYPRRHTGKKVGTCGALPRHGRFSATQTARAPRLTPLNFSHRTEQLLGDRVVQSNQNLEPCCHLAMVLDF